MPVISLTSFLGSVPLNVVYIVRVNEWITKRQTRLRRRNTVLGFSEYSLVLDNLSTADTKLKLPKHPTSPFPHAHVSYHRLVDFPGEVSSSPPSFLLSILLSLLISRKLSQTIELSTCFSSKLSGCFVPAVKTRGVNIRHVCSLGWCRCLVLHT